MNNIDHLVSDRLAVLKDGLDRGSTTALDAFWAQVEGEGSPLIEPLPDAGSLVTFLWRADEATEHVSLVGGPEGADLHKHRLRRLGGSNVFFRGYRVPNDLRTEYWFAVNPPLIRDCTSDHQLDDEGWTRLTTFLSDPEALKSDPLNRRRERYRNNPNDPQSKAFGPGVLELPSAPAQPWIARREGVARGSLHQHTFRSKLLGNERLVWVYTPPCYEEVQESHGWLLVFDGGAYLTRIPTHRILDNLLAERRVPPLVAVLVDNPDLEARVRELTLCEPFAEFIATELTDWVRESYRVTTDPSQTVVAGSSLGGLTASFVALRHPALFGNVLSQSGSYSWGPGRIVGRHMRAGEFEEEWLAKQYAITPRLPLRFWLEAGVLEEAPDPSNLLGANRRFRDMLVEKGYPVLYQEFVGGHDYSCWRGSLGDGLVALVGAAEPHSR